MTSYQSPELQRFTPLTPDSYHLAVLDLEHEDERTTVGSHVNAFLHELEAACPTPDTIDDAWADLTSELDLEQGNYRLDFGISAEAKWKFKVPVMDAGNCILASLETQVAVSGAARDKQSDEFTTALSLVRHNPLKELDTKYREAQVRTPQLLGVDGRRTRLLLPRYEFSEPETYAALRVAVGKEILATSDRKVNAQVRFCTETMDPLKKPTIFELCTYMSLDSGKLTPADLVLSYMAQATAAIRASKNI